MKKKTLTSMGPYTVLLVFTLALFVVSPFFSQDMLGDNSQADQLGQESDMVSREQQLGGQGAGDPGQYDSAQEMPGGNPEDGTQQGQLGSGEGSGQSGAMPGADGETPESIQNPPPGEIPADDGSPADTAAQGGQSGGGQSGGGNEGMSGGGQAGGGNEGMSGGGQAGGGNEEMLGSGQSGSGSENSGQSGGQSGGGSQPGGQEQSGSGEEAAASEPAPEPELLPRQSGTLYHAADLLQSRVVNGEGEDAGTLSDIVLNESGRVEYYVIRLEQFMEMQPGQYLVMFDKVTVEPDGTRTRVKLDLPAPERELILAQNDLQIRQQIGPGPVLYTALMRYRVGGEDGKSIGAIEDLVLDVEKAEVIYAAFAPAANLGSGGELIAMPFRDLVYDVENRTVRIETNAEELEGAKTFSDEEWPAEAATNWRPYF